MFLSKLFYSVPQPDLIFPVLHYELDQGNILEKNVMILHQQRKATVYALLNYFDDGYAEVAYVGRSTKILSRLQDHFSGRSGILYKWLKFLSARKDRWEFQPFVAVWVIKDWGAEGKLQSHFSPYLNCKQEFF